ncbi:MAG: DUF5132 domain-containing protein [Pseudomonadota bacterium]|nr:DUF5132 domain-containing protein [Pseudomonadota bacterium]
MAVFEKLTKSDVVKGVAIGLGVIAVAPVVVPVLSKLSRPSARAAARSGNVLYEKGLETLVELQEVMEDFVAEAKVELAKRESGLAEATTVTTADAAESSDK